MRKLAFTAIIFFTLGVAVTYFLNKPKQVVTTDSPKIEQPNPMGYIAQVKTSKGTIYIHMSKDYIYFNPFETAVNNGKLITLKKEEYPKLFKQGIANLSVFQAVEYVDPQSKEMFIKLSNSQPDHGGFASTYVLLVNSFTGEIKEGENDYSTRLNP